MENPTGIQDKPCPHSTDSYLDLASELQRHWGSIKKHVACERGTDRLESGEGNTLFATRVAQIRAVLGQAVSVVEWMSDKDYAIKVMLSDYAIILFCLLRVKCFLIGSFAYVNGCDWSMGVTSLLRRMRAEQRVGWVERQWVYRCSCSVRYRLLLVLDVHHHCSSTENVTTRFTSWFHHRLSSPITFCYYFTPYWFFFADLYIF